MKYVTLLLIIMSLLPACEKENADEKFKREFPYPEAKTKTQKWIIIK